MSLRRFRVWFDDTVQPADETPFDWMGDDFVIVDARDELHAVAVARGKLVLA